MRESTYFVLAALRGERLHGYAIIKRAAELSGGRVTLAAGTLYAALDRLAGSGYVVDDGEEVVNGRARRYYRLTGAGEEALVAEAARMMAAAKVVEGGGRAARVAPVVRPA
jgi:DNA-binding PadR family transcriptional regulator